MIKNIYKFFAQSSKAQSVLSEQKFAEDLKGLQIQPKKFVNSKQTCPICLQENEQVVCFLECNHTFCKTCLIQHVNASIDESKQILCPQQSCKKIFSAQSQIFQMLSRQYYIKHRKFLQKKEHLQNPQKHQKPCPKIECLGLLKKKYNECKQCRQVYCVYCLGQKHSGKCDAIMIQRYCQIMNFMNCPSCNMVVEKNLGCSHIKCFCGFDFCYVCGKPGNHSSCNGKKKFEQPTPISFFEKFQMESSRNPQNYRFFFEPVDSNIDMIEYLVYDKEKRKYKITNTILSMLFLYPLILILICLQFLFFVLLIHILIIIACFILLPWRYQKILLDMDFYKTANNKKRRIIKCILLLLLPISYTVLFMKDICCLWFCNFEKSCGCCANVKRQLLGGLRLVLLPVTIYQKVKNKFYWQ